MRVEPKLIPRRDVSHLLRLRLQSVRQSHRSSGALQALGELEKWVAITIAELEGRTSEERYWTYEELYPRPVVSSVRSVSGTPDI